MPIDTLETSFHKLRAQIIAARKAQERNAEQDLLQLAASHRNNEIRRSAMVTLREFRSESLWPIIHEVLARSKSEILVETAIKCVGEIGSEVTESLLASIHVAAQRARFGEQAAKNAELRLARKSRGGSKSHPAGSTRRRHVFLCHSSDDKLAVVEPLVQALKLASVSCWYDRAEILPGDSISQKVNEGLSISRYVLAVLSPSFLGKRWPERELNAIINIEASTGIVKLVVLLVGGERHRSRVFERFPLLNDKLYIEWNGDPVPVVDAIKRRIVSDQEQ